MAGELELSLPRREGRFFDVTSKGSGLGASEGPYTSSLLFRGESKSLKTLKTLEVLVNICEPSMSRWKGVLYIKMLTLYAAII